MAFLNNVATRSNDQEFLLPRTEPTSDIYLRWKEQNYSTELLAAYNEIAEGYRNAYGNSGMWKFFKILKNAGLLGAENMSRGIQPKPIVVAGRLVVVAGREIYVDDEGFEL